jgi:hypothetical protein
MRELNPTSLENFARTLPIATQVVWRKINTHMNTKPLPTPQTHTHKTQEEINSSQQLD